VDDIRLRDSLSLAKEAGLAYSFFNVRLKDAHPNTVVLEVSDRAGRRVKVQAASVGGGEIVIQSIDDMEAGFSGKENTFVLTYRDTPGMIARITGEIASSRLNIATMRVFRQSAGGVALVALELDSPAEGELIERLKALAGVYHVAYLAAREQGEA
jgi:L-serine dehydratase